MIYIFHLDNKYDVEARRFCSILDSQLSHIKGATHNVGDPLDLVIRKESSYMIIGAPSVFDPFLSSNKDRSLGYHLAVHVIINIDKPD